jgi:hypothetical protein
MGIKVSPTSSVEGIEDGNEILEDQYNIQQDQQELQDDSTMLLHQIIKELKIMNFHLSLLTDNTITKQEVE